jgi:hypothetical protein
MNTTKVSIHQFIPLPSLAHSLALALAHVHALALAIATTYDLVLRRHLY